MTNPLQRLRCENNEHKSADTVGISSIPKAPIEHYCLIHSMPFMCHSAALCPCGGKRALGKCTAETGEGIQSKPTKNQVINSKTTDFVHGLSKSIALAYCPPIFLTLQ